MRSTTQTLRILKLKSRTAVAYLFCAFEIMDVVSRPASAMTVAVPGTGVCPECENGPKCSGGEWRSGVKREPDRVELTIPASIAYRLSSARFKFNFLRKRRRTNHYSALPPRQFVPWLFLDPFDPNGCVNIHDPLREGNAGRRSIANGGRAGSSPMPIRFG